MDYVKTPYEIFFEEIGKIDKTGIDAEKSSNMTPMNEERLILKAPPEFRNFGTIILKSGNIETREGMRKELERIVNIANHLRTLGYEPNKNNLSCFVDDHGIPYHASIDMPHEASLVYDAPNGGTYGVKHFLKNRNDDTGLILFNGESLDRVFIGFYPRTEAISF